jgi:uncharacterized membrane protein YbhN (UPF0104 family)
MLVLTLTPLVAIYNLIRYRHSTKWFKFTGHLIADISVLIFMILALVIQFHLNDDSYNVKDSKRSLLILAIISIGAELLISVISLLISLFIGFLLLKRCIFKNELKNK